MATAAHPDVPTVHLHIGHERRTAGSGGTYQHLHPVRQTVQATIPLAGPGEVDAAVARATAVQEQWRRTRPEERRDILNRLADLLAAHRTELGRMAALDGGTTIAERLAQANPSQPLCDVEPRPVTIR